MPDIDLVGHDVTPFTYQADPAPQKGYDSYPQMAQQAGVSVPVMAGVGSGHGMSDMRSTTTGSHYPTTITDNSVGGMQNQDWRGPSPGPSLVTSGTLPSSKADSERRRLQLANDEHGEGGSNRVSGSGSGSNIIVQHRDAGLLQQHVPEEIPPSYDSIPPDQLSGSDRSVSLLDHLAVPT